MIEKSFFQLEKLIDLFNNTKSDLEDMEGWVAWGLLGKRVYVVFDYKNGNDWFYLLDSYVEAVNKNSLFVTHEYRQDFQELPLDEINEWWFTDKQKAIDKAKELDKWDSRWSNKNEYETK